MSAPPVDPTPPGAGATALGAPAAVSSPADRSAGDLAPTRAVESIKTDVEQIKESVHR